MTRLAFCMWQIHGSSRVEGRYVSMFVHEKRKPRALQLGFTTLQSTEDAFRGYQGVSDLDIVCS